MTSKIKRWAEAPKQPRPRLQHHAPKYQVGQGIFHPSTQRFGEVLKMGDGPNMYDVMFDDGLIAENVLAVDLQPAQKRIFHPSNLSVGDTVIFNNNEYTIIENDEFFKEMTIQHIKHPNIVMTKSWDDWHNLGLKEVNVQKYNETVPPDYDPAQQ